MEEKRETSSSQSTSKTFDTNKKTFKKRKGTTDVGKDYENLYMAYLIFNLLKTDVKNFYVWSNDQQFGAFDDVILETQSAVNIKCALQLKHIVQGGTITLDSLKADKGIFSIKKYFETYQENRELLAGYNLIIFTNMQFNTKKTIELQHPNKTSFEVKFVEVDIPSLLNTSNKKGFKLEIVGIVQNDKEKETGKEKTKGKGKEKATKKGNQKNEDKGKEEIKEEEKAKGNDEQKQTEEGKLKENLKAREEYEEFFKIFFIYANQLNVNDLKSNVYKQMRDDFYLNNEMSEKYLHFFADWNLGEDDKDKLHKSMMERLTALYMVSESIHPIYFGPNCTENRRILQTAILKFHVTVTSKTSDCLWIEDLNNLHLEEARNININYQITTSKIDEIKDISDEECTKFLWLLDKCPLIVNESKKVYKALKLCRDRSFILLINNLSEELKEFLFFHNLTDLKSHEMIYSNVLSNFRCLVPGTEKKLGELVGNNEMKNNITTNELWLMVDNAYHFKQNLEYLPVPYISRRLSRNIIDYTFLSQIDKETLVLVTNCTLEEKEKFINKSNVLDVKKYLEMSAEEINTNEAVVLTTEENNSVEKFRAICAKSERKSCHHLRIFHGMLEWVCTSGDISMLRQYHTQDGCIEEKELWPTNYENYIHLLTTDPGLGKTLLVQSLKNMFFYKALTISFTPQDMKKICVFLKNNDKNVDELCNYIVQMKYSKRNKLDQYIVRSLIDKNEIIYFWDGIDEIVSDQNLNTITEVIGLFSKRGIVQWITCRQHLKTTLELKFGVLSRTLIHFNENQKTEYLQGRLKSVCPTQEDLDQVVVNLLKIDVLNVPLHLSMITKLCCENQDNILQFKEGVFSLVKLYDYFVDQKFKVYYEKDPRLCAMEPEELEQEKRALIRRFEKAALKMLLDNDELNELNINAFEIEEGIQKTSVRVGIVTEISKNNSEMRIKFAHDSFAEYFVAKYLSRRKFAKNKENMFEEKYTNIKHFLDDVDT